MVSKQTLKVFQTAVDRFHATEQPVLEDCHSSCGCPQPGTQSKCQDCPVFRAYVARLQQNVCLPGKEKLPTILAPTLQSPFSEEIKHQSVSLYNQGFTIEEIQGFIGVNRRETIRDWLYKAGALKTEGSYSSEIRQQCVELYGQGWSLKEIEDSMRVSAEAISHWVSDAGISRTKRSYSEQERHLCLELYQQGKELHEIGAVTGIHPASIREWVVEAGCLRQRRYYGSGRPPIYSQECREECLRLLEEGQTTAQVELLKGVSAGTILQWVKQSKTKRQLDTQK